MRKIVLIAHNLRSTHNVGSLLRTADGLGVSKVYLTGYTPYPAANPDSRLPHEAMRVDRQITKTALGAEKTQPWEHHDDVFILLEELKRTSFAVAALEQSPGAIRLPDFNPPDRIALVLGRETEGLEPEILAACNHALEIPMFGSKESFNVVQAAAMALYHLRFR